MDERSNGPVPLAMAAWHRLCDAVVNGHIKDVRDSINQCANLLDTQFSNDNNPLLLAVHSGHTEIVKILLRHNFDPNCRDQDGYSALQKASALGYVDIVRLLLQHDCITDTPDNLNGNCALHEAAWRGYSQTLELLIKHGSNVFQTNKNGFTALHLAAQNGHNQSTRGLLLAGCDPHIKNNYGDTALHTAARYGHAGVARILLSAHCRVNEVNKNNDTALHISCALRRRKITKILLQHGANVHVRNKQNETPLEIARRKDFPDIAAMINEVLLKDQPPVFGAMETAITKGRMTSGLVHPHATHSTHVVHVPDTGGGTAKVAKGVAVPVALTVKGKTPAAPSGLDRLKALLFRSNNRRKQKDSTKKLFNHAGCVNVEVLGIKNSSSGGKGATLALGANFNYSDSETHSSVSVSGPHATGARISAPSAIAASGAGAHLWRQQSGRDAELKLTAPPSLSQPSQPPQPPQLPSQPLQSVHLPLQGQIQQQVAPPAPAQRLAADDAPVSAADRKMAFGLFDHYRRLEGMQYYRDLAGNVHQGPIGYAPVDVPLPGAAMKEETSLKPMTAPAPQEPLPSTADHPAHPVFDADAQVGATSQYQDLLAARELIDQQLAILASSRRFNSPHAGGAVNGVAMGTISRAQAVTPQEPAKTYLQSHKARLKTAGANVDMDSRWMDAKMVQFERMYHQPATQPMGDDHHQPQFLVRTRSDESLSVSDYKAKHKVLPLRQAIDDDLSARPVFDPSRGGYLYNSRTDLHRGHVPLGYSYANVAGVESNQMIGAQSRDSMVWSHKLTNQNAAGIRTAALSRNAIASSAQYLDFNSVPAQPTGLNWRNNMISFGSASLNPPPTLKAAIRPSVMSVAPVAHDTMDIGSERRTVRFTDGASAMDGLHQQAEAENHDVHGEHPSPIYQLPNGSQHTQTQILCCHGNPKRVCSLCGDRLPPVLQRYVAATTIVPTNTWSSGRVEAKDQNASGALSAAAPPWATTVGNTGAQASQGPAESPLLTNPGPAIVAHNLRVGRPAQTANFLLQSSCTSLAAVGTTAVPPMQLNSKVASTGISAASANGTLGIFRHGQAPLVGAGLGVLATRLSRQESQRQQLTAAVDGSVQFRRVQSAHAGTAGDCLSANPVDTAKNLAVANGRGSLTPNQTTMLFHHENGPRQFSAATNEMKSNKLLQKASLESPLADEVFSTGVFRQSNQFTQQECDSYMKQPLPAKLRATSLDQFGSVYQSGPMGHTDSIPIDRSLLNPNHLNVDPLVRNMHISATGMSQMRLPVSGDPFEMSRSNQTFMPDIAEVPRVPKGAINDNASTIGGHALTEGQSRTFEPQIKAQRQVITANQDPNFARTSNQMIRPQVQSSAAAASVTHRPFRSAAHLYKPPQPLYDQVMRTVCASAAQFEADTKERRSAATETAKPVLASGNYHMPCVGLSALSGASVVANSVESTNVPAPPSGLMPCGCTDDHVLSVAIQEDHGVDGNTVTRCNRSSQSHSQVQFNVARGESAVVSSTTEARQQAAKSLHYQFNEERLSNADSGYDGNPPQLGRIDADAQFAAQFAAPSGLLRSHNAAMVLAAGSASNENGLMSKSNSGCSGTGSSISNGSSEHSSPCATATICEGGQLGVSGQLGPPLCLATTASLANNNARNLTNLPTTQNVTTLPIMAAASSSGSGSVAASVSAPIAGNTSADAPCDADAIVPAVGGSALELGLVSASLPDPFNLSNENVPGQTAQVLQPYKSNKQGTLDCDSVTYCQMNTSSVASNGAILKETVAAATMAVTNVARSLSGAKNSATAAILMSSRSFNSPFTRPTIAAGATGTDV